MTNGGGDGFTGGAGIRNFRTQKIQKPNYSSNMNLQSILFYVLLVVLTIAVLQSVSIGGLFFLKNSGEKRANTFFGLLLIGIGLTLLHHILNILGIYESYPNLNFLPIYFTLALPTCLFFYVKLNLYPQYELRWTDLKHFILPLGQWIFFLSIFIKAAEYKSGMGRYFYSPFYGAFEQFLYLTTFFAYMYFAYRYLRQKRKQVRSLEEARKLVYLRYLLKVFFVLFCVHTLFVVGDFFTYEFLNINLRSFKVYAGLGILSFAALVYWLGIYGFQVLIWGKGKV